MYSAKFAILLSIFAILTHSVLSAQYIGTPVDQPDTMLIWEGTVDYPVNSAVLDTAYMENRMALARIDTLADSIKNHIDSILIVGTASPEGRSGFNFELAGERVRVLRDYIIDKYSLPDTNVIRTSVRVFSWDEIIPQLKSDTCLPDSAAVLKVLENPDRTDFSKGWTLRTRKSDAYHYINSTYLDYMRKGTISVLYHQKFPPPLSLPTDCFTASYD